jgi:hypothetical protein
MQKKILFGVAALLAFATIFAVSCSNTLEVSDDNNIVLALPGPGNVKALPYDGAILVTWDAVKDASAYDVYRKDVATGLVDKIKTDVTVTYYADIVSLKNPLADAAKYQYTVVAKSAGSDSAVIWNGQSSSAEVIAQVPTTVGLTPATGVTAAVEGSYIVVRWNTAATPTAPNFTQYSVRAVTADGSITETITGTYTGVDQSTGLGAYFSTKHAATVPATGGTTTVYVDAKWVDASYPGATAAPVTVPYGGITLAAVSGVNATRSTTTPTSVLVAWNTVAGATGYDVYRADYSGSAQTSNWASLTSTTDPSYTDTTVDADKGYKYGVVAKNSTARSSSIASYNLAAGTFTGTPTTAPIAARIAETPTSVQVTWGFVAGATGYELQRVEYVSGVQFGDWAFLSNETGTQYVDTPVAIGKDYRYRVIAKKGSLEATPTYGSTTNLATSVSLGTPGSVSAIRVAGTPTDVVVKWNFVQYATGYEVYRAEFTTGGAQLTDYTALTLQPSGTALTVTDTGADIDKQYYYRVYATNGTARSSAGTASTAGQTLSTPVNYSTFTVTKFNGSNDVYLSWVAVANAVTYKVQRAPFAAVSTAYTTNSTVYRSDEIYNYGAWVTLTATPTSNGTTYTLVDTGTNPTLDYVYTIVGVNGNGTVESPAPYYDKFLRHVDTSLAAPSALSASNVRNVPNTKTGATFTWTQDSLTSGAAPDGYVLQYAEIASFVYTEAPTVSISSGQYYNNYRGNYIVIDGAWNDVTTIPTTSLSGTTTTYSVDVDNLALDKAYIFRLAAKQGTTLLGGYTYYTIAKDSTVTSPNTQNVTASYTLQGGATGAGDVTYTLQLPVNPNVDSYDVEIETWDPDGLKVTSGDPNLATATKLVASEGSAYELWTLDNLNVRYTYQYTIKETTGGVTTTPTLYVTANGSYLGTGGRYLDSTNYSGIFGSTINLASALYLQRTSGGSVTDPTGVTGAYQIAVRVQLPAFYGDLSFDVYRARKTDVNGPYEGGTEVWTKLNTTPVAFDEDLTYTADGANGVNIFSAGFDYWVYNDVLGEANVGNYYNYYVVAYSAITGEVIGTTPQYSLSIRPSTADTYFTNTYLTWNYTTDGQLDNEATLKGADSGNYASTKNGNLYWSVSGADRVLIGQVDRATAIRAQDDEVAALIVDDLYIDLVRPDAKDFKDAFTNSVASTRTITIDTKTVSGGWATRATGLLVRYDGTSGKPDGAFSIEGRFANTALTLTAPITKNAVSGYNPSSSALDGTNGAYQINVQTQVTAITGYNPADLSYDVYRSTSSATTYPNGTKVTAAPVPYSTSNAAGGVYFNGTYLYYNDTVGEANLGANYYYYYVVAHSDLLPTGNDIVVISSTSTNAVRPTTAATYLPNFTWVYTDEGQLDNEATLRLSDNGTFASAKNGKLYWSVSSNSTTVLIGEIDRSAGVRASSNTVASLSTNDLYIDLVRPTASDFKAAFTSGVAGTQQISIATRNETNAWVSRDTGLLVRYDGTGGRPDGAFSIEGRFGTSALTLTAPYITNTTDSNGPTSSAINGVKGAYQIDVRTQVTSLTGYNLADVSYDVYRSTSSLGTGAVKVNSSPIPYNTTANGIYWSGTYLYYNDTVGEAGLGISYYYNVVVHSDLLPATDDIVVRSTWAGPATISTPATYAGNLLGTSYKVRSTDTTQVGFVWNTTIAAYQTLIGARVYVTPTAIGNGNVIPGAVTPVPRLVGTVAYTTVAINSPSVDSEQIAIPANSYYLSFAMPDETFVTTLPGYSGNATNDTFRYSFGAKSSSATGNTGLSLGAYNFSILNNDATGTNYTKTPNGIW